LYLTIHKLRSLYTMKVIKFSAVFLLCCSIALAVAGQDVVMLDSANFVRGTIKGTDYSTVSLLKDDQVEVLYKAKDVKEFLWNGETYVSKPIINKNKAENRFFKVVEIGAVNLYAIGEQSAVAAPQEKRVRVSPQVGIGLGNGGFGGVGFGGGITIGGGRRNAAKQSGGRKALYFIEKPGTGPMLEIQLNNGGDQQRVKQILLDKLNNDEDLAERIKETEQFDAKSVAAFVKAYNLMHK
jgi:hypothetical protein